jgi:hypothetical protein
VHSIGDCIASLVVFSTKLIDMTRDLFPCVHSRSLVCAVKPRYESRCIPFWPKPTESCFPASNATTLIFFLVESRRVGPPLLPQKHLQQLYLDNPLSTIMYVPVPLTFYDSFFFYRVAGLNRLLDAMSPPSIRVSLAAPHSARWTPRVQVRVLRSVEQTNHAKHGAGSRAGSDVC